MKKELTVDICNLILYGVLNALPPREQKKVNKQTVDFKLKTKIICKQYTYNFHKHIFLILHEPKSRKNIS